MGTLTGNEHINDVCGILDGKQHINKIKAENENETNNETKKK